MGSCVGGDRQDMSAGMCVPPTTLGSLIAARICTCVAWLSAEHDLVQSPSVVPASSPQTFALAVMSGDLEPGSGAEWQDALDALMHGGGSSSSEQENPGWAAALADVGLDVRSSDEDDDQGGQWQAALGELGAHEEAESSDDHPSLERDVSSEDLGIVPYEACRPQGLGAIVHLMHYSCRSADEDLDRPLLAAARQLLEEEALLATTTAKAKELGVDRKLLPLLYTRLAALGVQMERRLWASVEQTVRMSPEVTPLVYVQMMSYDSADFRMQVFRKLVLAATGSPLLEAEEGGQPSGHADCDATVTETSAGTQKVLQSDHAVLMLVRIGTRHAILRGSSATWLQVCDRNTGEVYKKCLEAQTMTSDSADAFPRKVRLACTDGASSIARTERHIMAGRADKGWSLLHLPCRVHIVSGITARFFDSSPDDVSGLVAVSLALGAPGQMGRFRQAVRTTLARKLRLVDAVHLSESASAFKRLVLGAFLGHRPAAEQLRLRLLLEKCCPGDWRDPTCWPIISRPGESRGDILKVMCKTFVQVLFGHTPFCFPRHRWTGAEKALMDIGLPMCLHNLFQEAFSEFMENHSDDNRRAAAGQREEADRVALVPFAAGRDEQDPTAAGAQGAQTWQEQNKQFRGKAREWMAGRPHLRILALAFVSQPLTGLMRKELDIAGTTWETKENAKLAAGTHQPTVIAGRSWPLLLAASRTHESECMKEIAEVSSQLSVRCLATLDMRASMETFVCQLVTRSGCCVFQNLMDRFDKFPYKLFLLLVDQGLKGVVSTACPSSLDPYSKDFFERYVDVTSPEALLELSTIAMTARTATVLLECRNAQIRRYVVGASIQTALPTIASISAKFVLRKLALRDRSINQPASLRHLRKKISKPGSRCRGGQTQPGAKRGVGKRGGGGGPWRAFVSDRCRGIASFAFKALSDEYRQLPDDQKAAFVRRGALGTLLHKQGALSFGAVRKSLCRAALQDQSHRRVLKALADQVTSSVLGPLKIKEMPFMELEAAAKMARVDELLMARMCKEEVAQAAEQLVSWRQTVGLSLRDKFVASWPSVAPLVLGLTAQPAGGECSVFDWACPSQLILPRLLAELGKPEHKAFVAALDQDWQEKHQEHRHSAQTPLAEEGARQRRGKPECIDAGVCLCGEGGALVWAFMCFVKNAFKQFTACGGATQIVNECKAVLRLTKHHFHDEVAGLCSDAGEQRRDTEGAASLFDTFWFIGLQYWSPVRSTFRACSWPSNKANGAGCIDLQCDDNYLSLAMLCAEQLASLREDGVWQARFYEVQVSDRPVLELDPRHIEVREVVGVPLCERRFPKATKRRRQWRGVADDWLAVVEGLPDDECDAERQSDASDDAADEGQSEVSGQSSGFSPSGSGSSEEDVLVSPLASDDEDVVEQAPAADNEHPGEANAMVGAERAGPNHEQHDASADALGDDVVVAGDGAEAMDVEEAGVPAGMADPAAPAGLAVPAAAQAMPRALAADFAAVFEFGIIRYYFSRREFVAHCQSPEHGHRCRLSRSSEESLSKRRAGQGRPIGLLGAWLMAGAADRNISSQWQHTHMRPMPSLSDRQAARMTIAAHAQGAGLLALERPAREGEPDEPETIQ